jgi:GR25 family glycosyltransferase involved in LPS biosynthesis/glycosyltransferase involved in cell wall biosynthesis
MTAEVKTICLTMIVKNEGHLIRDTLEHLCQHFTFSTWAISDTGSTDGTQDIIRTFFAERGIPGVLAEEPWQDFGYNRTKAFELAYNRSDYALVWDADDSIEGKLVLPTPLTADSYKFTFGDGGACCYERPQLFNNRKRWKYVGVLHEYAASIDSVGPDQRVLGAYHFVSGRRGARSKDPEKYLKDALVLEKALETEPDNARYVFYCGNSWISCGQGEKAIPHYKRLLKMAAWAEEKYVACIELWDIYERMGKVEEAIPFAIDAFKYSPDRVECAYRLIKHYCVKDMNKVALGFYTPIQDYIETRYLTDNPSRFLFCRSREYNFFLPYYMIIVAEKCGRPDIAVKLYKLIFAKGYTQAGPWWIANLFFNIQFALTAIPTENTQFLDDMMGYMNRAGRGGFKPETDQAVAKVIDLFRGAIAAPLNPLRPLCQDKKGSPKIVFTMTTCKRWDLFEKTMNSILRYWKDLDVVDYFFCVDDNSSPADQQRMRDAYPFFDFHFKGPAKRGHRQSMNIIWQVLQELQPKYWIHMEDDWLFFKEDTYVTKAIGLLERQAGANIHQVLFNRNYTETYDWGIQGGDPLEHGFTVHVQTKDIQGRNCAYWPHYSFRPSVVRVAPILALGNYDSPNSFFEMDYANRWTSAGHKSAFFDDVTCLHIGKLTSDKSGTNAYTLNGVSQFGGAPEKEQSPVLTAASFIVNLKRRPDRRAAAETCLRANGITEFTVFDAVDGRELVETEEIRKKFAGNDFGSKRGVIGCALSHETLWRQLQADPEHDMYIVFEDDIRIDVSGFRVSLAAIVAEVKTTTTDVCYLGYTTYNDAVKHTVAEGGKNRTVVLDRNTYVGGTFAYIITKGGAQKLVDYIAKHGIKHGIDYIMKIVPGLVCQNAQPHLVLSDWVRPGSNSQVDSDIQRDHTPIKQPHSAEWVYVEGKDSPDNDIGRLDNRGPLQAMLSAALLNPECMAINTVGFQKSRVGLPLVSTPWINPHSGGIYIRKQYYDILQRPVRVKFLCNWCSSEQLVREWKRMTKGNCQWNAILMTAEDTDIDYWVIVNRPPPSAIFDPARTIVFHMEPWCGDASQTWGVKTWGEWAAPDPTKYLAVRSHQNAVNNAFWQIPQDYHTLKALDATSKKTKGSIIASVCSSKYFDPGHKKRIDFLKFIEAKQDPDVLLDIYNADNKHRFSSYRGRADPDIDKDKALLPYKYYFMCENNAEHNFVTEKLWEPILTETLCFYWGCPNVTDIVDPRAYVLLDMEDFEGSFATIKKALVEDWWAQRLPHIRAEKQRILETMTIMPTVERVHHQQVVRPLVGSKCAVFIHSCQIPWRPACQERLYGLLDELVAAPDLLSQCDTIFINNIGAPLTLPDRYTMALGSRLHIHQYSHDFQLFELPTLRLMSEFAKHNPDANILYLHTKGISYTGHIYTCSTDWIRMMTYALITNANGCRAKLGEGYDTVGCNYSISPSPHYSGNFWWAKAAAVARLPLHTLTDKMSAEMWVLSDPAGNPFTVFNSEINHFSTEIPPEKYEQAIRESLCTGGTR